MLQRHAIVLFSLLALLLAAGSVIAQDEETTPEPAPESTPEAAPDPEPLTLEHDGLERTYHLSVPPTYDDATAAPLVLVLHGASGSGLEMQTALSFDELGAASGHIVAYPDGLDNTWVYDEGLFAEDAPDDVGFLGALIDELASSYNIGDVYLMGWSNGGLMALRARCDLAERLEGVAVVGATLTFALAQDCAGAAPVSLLQIIGTADQAFPWEGRATIEDDGTLYTTMSIVQTVGFLTSQGACANTTANEDVQPFGSPVTVRLWGYGNCTDDTVYQLYGIVGQEHAWPNGNLFRLADGRPGDAQRIIWEFFGADLSTQES